MPNREMPERKEKQEPVFMRTNRTGDFIAEHTKTEQEYPFNLTFEAMLSEVTRRTKFPADAVKQYFQESLRDAHNPEDVTPDASTYNYRIVEKESILANADPILEGAFKALVIEVDYPMHIILLDRREVTSNLWLRLEADVLANTGLLVYNMVDWREEVGSMLVSADFPEREAKGN